MDTRTKELQQLISVFFKTEEAMSLVYFGADPSVKDNSRTGSTLMHILVRDMYQFPRDRDAVEELVNDYKVDMNIKDRAGRTPLQILLSLSGMRARADDAMFLVDLGADPRVKNDRGTTLLHLLVMGMKDFPKNKYAIKKLVQKYGVDVNIKDRDGKTPLQRLISEPAKPDDAMFLVSLGADPLVKNDSGNALLHLLVMNMKDVPNNRYAIKELVEEYKVSINDKNSRNRTPLQLLISFVCMPDDAMFLVRLGANPMQQSRNGNTLLHLLVRNMHMYPGNRFFIRELIEKYNVPIDILSKQGITPLDQLIHDNPSLFNLDDAMWLIDEFGASMYDRSSQNILSGRQKMQEKSEAELTRKEMENEMRKERKKEKNDKEHEHDIAVIELDPIPERRLGMR